MRADLARALQRRGAAREIQQHRHVAPLQLAERGRDVVGPDHEDIGSTEHFLGLRPLLRRTPEIQHGLHGSLAISEELIWTHWRARNGRHPWRPPRRCGGAVGAVDQPAVGRAAMGGVERDRRQAIAVVGFPLVEFAVAVGVLFGASPVCSARSARCATPCRRDGSRSRSARRRRSASEVDHASSLPSPARENPIFSIF